MRKEKKEKRVKRSIGFYVGLFACVLTIVNLFVYNLVPPEIYNMFATVWSFGGVALFLVLSIFKRTSGLAPIALMACDFMALLAFVQADGTIDYFSTQFFDGFSMQALFALPTAVWGSIVTFIAAFAVASIAMYLPQVRRKK